MSGGQHNRCSVANIVVRDHGQTQRSIHGGAVPKLVPDAITATLRFSITAWEAVIGERALRAGSSVIDIGANSVILNIYSGYFSNHFTEILQCSYCADFFISVYFQTGQGV